jgi:uncharacterized membrane protein
MALDDRSSGAEVKWWHWLAHAVAFCIAAVIGGILVYPSYPRFEAHTDTAGEAFGAFLTCCVIAGGIGPLVTLCLFGLAARAHRLR